MDHFAGLDVSVKETSVCIVDDTGRIVREAKVASEPKALLSVLKNPAYHFKRIGLEAGPLSQWLFSALAEAGLPVICVETRHMRAVLKAQINKIDRNDARGMAQMMRAGLYRPVHVKTLRGPHQGRPRSRFYVADRRGRSSCDRGPGHTACRRAGARRGNGGGRASADGLSIPEEVKAGDLIAYGIEYPRQPPSGCLLRRQDPERRQGVQTSIVSF